MKIIAEVGSNWRKEADIYHSIVKAKECGADAVKFQLLTALELYGSEAYGEHMHDQYINPEWLPTMASLCKEVGIEFMCTAFSSGGYTVVEPFVKTHKIASAELTDPTILNRVNSFGKPVYLSTGGSDFNEISQALGHLKGCAVTIMFCVADYPAKIVDFRHLELLKERFGGGYRYGYSDHSTDALNIPRIAKNRGCEVIEKHVNFITHSHTPDAGHSLDEVEFSLMVKMLRGKEASPVVTDKMTNTEMRRLHKRRLVATRSIEVGEEFRLGYNIGFFRPRSIRNQGEFASTFRPWDVADKRSSVSLTMGQPILMSDVEEVEVRVEAGA